VTLKHFAKKRESVRAVQWQGEITPDLRELAGDRDLRVDDDRQLMFANAKGPGRFAGVGDWIVSTSGEDLFAIGDEVFRAVYEEVDRTGLSLSPTDAEVDKSYTEFVQKLDTLLVDALRLSSEAHHGIWRDRTTLLTKLRHLLEDHGYTAARRELARIRDKITKELWP
jgi:hypothetical protein